MEKDAMRKEIQLLKSLVISADDVLEEISCKVNKIKEQITLEENTHPLQAIRNVEDITKKLISFRNELEKELSNIHNLKVDIVEMNKIIAELEQKLVIFDNNK